MIPPELLTFFITTAAAGGALIGLLFVSISVAPHRTVQPSAPIEARVMSSNAFIALINGFFISLGAVQPYWNIGGFALVMSLVGLSNSLNQGWLILRPWPSWQNVLRRVWLIGMSLFLYTYELVIAIDISISPTHTSIFTLGILIMSIYGIALMRAWELLGVQRTGLLAWLNPLYEMSKSKLGDEHTDQSDFQQE